MTTRGTRKEVAEAARKLLRPKIDAVAALAEAGAQRDAQVEAIVAAQDALKPLESTYAEQYRKARELGWTDTELAELGLAIDSGAPAPRVRRQTRKRQTSTPDDAAAATPPDAPTSFPSGAEASESAPTTVAS